MTTTAGRTHYQQGAAPHRQVTQATRQHPHRGVAGQHRETGREVTAEVPTTTVATLSATTTHDTTLSALLDLRTEAEVTGDAIPCREYDAELWFAESPADVEFAKALCGTCPAITECLAGALERREPWGVWGGQLFVQGVVVPRKRPRGRPRKNDVAA
jgi:WhiB family transcriptional regulator, redox-sensing transcriptional regulator